MRLLLEHGADIDKPDGEGKRAIDLDREHGQDEMTAPLQAASERS